MRHRIAIVLGVLAALAAIVVCLQIASRNAVRTLPSERGQIASNDLDPHSSLATPESTDHARHAAAEAPQASGASAPATGSNTATLTVQVIGKVSRSPIEGVRVYASPEDSDESDQAQVSSANARLHEAPISGTDGQVELQVAAGSRVQLVAIAERENADSRDVVLPALKSGERRSVRLDLSDGDDLPFHCIVLAHDSRAPVGGAKLSIVRQMQFTTQSADEGRGARAKEVATVVSDRDGYAALSTATWQRQYVEIKADGFSPIVAVPMRGHEDKDHAMVVLLDRGATLNVEVLDTAGAPFSGVIVRLQTLTTWLLQRSVQGRLDGYLTGKTTWASTTDSQGRCVLSPLPAGVSLDFVVLRGETVLKSKSQPLKFESGETRVIRWQVGGGCTVSGVLVDEKDAPIARHEIWLTRPVEPEGRSFSKFMGSQIDHKASTDEHGRFRFDDVEPGVWRVGPAPETDPWIPAAEDALAAPAQTITIANDAQTFGITLRTQRGLFIRGHVLDSHGMPAPDVHVTGAIEDGSMTVVSVTHDQGEFVLGPILPGRFSVSASGQGSDFGSESVIATAGARDVVLKLRLGGAIKGRIVGEDDAVGPRTDIRLIASGSGFASAGLVHDERGVFERAGIQPGAYALTATTHDGRIAVLRGVVVAAGQTVDGLVLAPQPGAKLVIRCDGAVSHYTCVARSGDLTVAIGWGGRGEPSSIFVPAGRLTLELRRDETAAVQTREIDVDVGDEKEITFAAER